MVKFMLYNTSGADHSNQLSKQQPANASRAGILSSIRSKYESFSVLSKIPKLYKGIDEFLTMGTGTARAAVFVGIVATLYFVGIPNALCTLALGGHALSKIVKISDVLRDPSITADKKTEHITNLLKGAAFEGFLAFVSAFIPVAPIAVGIYGTFQLLPGGEIDNNPVSSGIHSIKKKFSIVKRFVMRETDAHDTAKELSLTTRDAITKAYLQFSGKSKKDFRLETRNTDISEFVDASDSLTEEDGKSFFDPVQGSAVEDNEFFPENMKDVTTEDNDKFFDVNE